MITSQYQYIKTNNEDVMSNENKYQNVN